MDGLDGFVAAMADQALMNQLLERDDLAVVGAQQLPRRRDAARVRVTRFPFVDIDANRAWLAVVCFADALVRWSSNSA